MAQAAPALTEERDDLDDYIAEQTARHPDFPALMEEAARRRDLWRDLSAARRGAGLSQAAVARRMQRSASAVARLEQGALNAMLATVQRYAAAVGKRLEWRLVDAPASEDGADPSTVGS